MERFRQRYRRMERCGLHGTMGQNKKRLIDIVDKMKLDDEPLKSYKEDTKNSSRTGTLKILCENLSYFKVDKCNRHRKEMLQKDVLFLASPADITTEACISCWNISSGKSEH